MTATERFYRGVKDDILSMDDPEDYGEVFSHMSFKEAIERELLTDYKVITIEVKKEEVAEFIKENNLVKLNAKWGKESEARSLASMIALRKAMKTLPIKNAVSFHSSIDRAVRSKEVQNYISETYNYKPIETFTVSGKLPTSKREVVVNEFANSNKALITNSRCLTEGLDVPNIDCIVFADPRKSKVDIVQALGRALRKKKGKEWGYVILPIIYDHSSQEIDNDNYQEILNIVRGLAANDERIIEEFKEKSQNSGRVIGAREEIFSIDPVLIEETELVNNLSVKLWEKLSTFKWRNFDEARKYARSLGLKSLDQWKEFCDSSKKPSDIPKFPDQPYKDKGWNGIGDWLGYDSHLDRKIVDIEKAREIVKVKRIKSMNQYREFEKNNKHLLLPASPSVFYKDNGWESFGHFFSTGRVANYKKNYRKFEEARKYARGLKLSSAGAWRKHCKEKTIPNDISKSPHNTYKNKGWVSWGDWLGTNNIADGTQEWASYEVSKAFAVNNNVKSKKDWNDFKNINKLPNNIPKNPYGVYKRRNEWKSWADFLGKE